VSDAEAYEYYEDPSKREPTAGPPRRRPDRPLTQHVPVRFPAETIEQVKRLADADGMTVSAWIRRAVERAVRQQGLADVEQIVGGDSARAVVERLQRDVAELAAALERSESQ
jgi:predicted DNA-binding protein